MNTSRAAIPAAAAIAAALVAGCGGGSPSTTASASGSSGPKDGIQAAYRFSACMRTHGVTGFPEPVVRHSDGHTEVGLKVTPTLSGSPAFQSAQKACAGILPGPMSPAQIAARQHYREQHFLAFAGCMRARGITNFPDPNSQGDIPMSLLAQAGINIHLPNVISAARACVPASGGLLTLAAISQATGSGSSQSGGGSGSQPSGGSG
jgi:hypothetical protein